MQGLQVLAGVRKEEDAETPKNSAADDLRPVFVNAMKPGLVAAAVCAVEEVDAGGITWLVNAT